MMTAWSHLPNATHIDRIIASVEAHPDVWPTARLPGSAALDSAKIAAWGVVTDDEWSAARAAQRMLGRANSASYAILALIAWDHSAKFLDMTSNELKMWWALSEAPAALLLLPAVTAFEQIKELEFA